MSTNTLFDPHGVKVSTPSGDVILNAGPNITIQPQGNLITISAVIPPTPVGQFVTTSVASSSAVGLHTAKATNITSISLGIGDWDVSGTIAFTAGISTTATIFAGGINTASSTLPTLPGFRLGISVGAGGTMPIQSVGPVRVKPTISATVYLVGQATFSASTMSAYGTIQARRLG